MNHTIGQIRKRKIRFVCKPSRNNVGWRPEDNTEYGRQLDLKLKDIMNEERLHNLGKSIDDKLEELGKLIVQTAAECRRVQERVEEFKKIAPEELKNMINERKLLQRTAKTKQRREELSKLIQKHFRKLLREGKRVQIAERLTEFSKLNQISAIKANGRRQLLQSVYDQTNVLQTGRQEIVDVFADFYEKLYTSAEQAPDASWRRERCEQADPFTFEDMKVELENMAKNKASDSVGMVVDMLQDGSEGLMMMVTELFNSIIGPRPLAPAIWKESCVKVLFKKGDAKNPMNYRPITLLRITYKLFSRMLCARIKKVLEQAQPVDQAGFRSGFGVEDHLFSMVMISELHEEFNVPFWICAIDYRGPSTPLSTTPFGKHWYSTECPRYMSEH